MALFQNGFMPALRNNSDTLLQTGIGLIGGRTANEQAAMGLQGFAQGRKENKTINFLRQNSPELAAAVESGALSGGDAYKLFYQQKLEAEKPKQPMVINGQLVDPATYEVLGDFRTPKDGSNGAEYGLTPQTGVDADGNPVLIQLGKGGVATQAQLPEGITLSKEPIKLDAGTHFVLLDPITRQPVGQIPKDLAEAERQKVGGKALGEADASLASMNSKMQGLESVVQRLDKLSETATYSLGGQILDVGMKQVGMDPRQAAIDRAEYIATVDNQVLPLLRDTFGAAFTQKEGDTLRQTLGDPDKSPAEKQQVLKAFIQQKRRDVEALSMQTGQTPSGAPARRRYNPATGALE
jgi:hypothetical protein